ncbi:hypothetical protein HMPREF9004_0626 [Schaalia cardiffensis F0333]|uniref:Uncharacterized protein n=1 Tax=Schaalia cardiffensis F0333 TaxID=888050 RepID=N6X581_9ACTO|nr:hypothetical protein HMPREF9004_0626 [Schaalia cardiffensis F0333]
MWVLTVLRRKSPAQATGKTLPASDGSNCARKQIELRTQITGRTLYTSAQQ